MRAPTTGSMEALRRVTRDLLGTQDAFVKLQFQSADPVIVELVGYSDSDWAGDPSSRKSQSSGHVEADGCPLTSFSRRQSCVATSSGMAEYYDMCSTSQELLHLRSILEHSLRVHIPQSSSLRNTSRSRRIATQARVHSGTDGEDVRVARSCS